MSSTLDGITWHAQGEANFYRLMRGNNWVAVVHLNGEMLVWEQEQLLNAMFQGQQPVAIPDKKPLPELMMASYHEAIGWNACIDAMLAGASAQAQQENLPHWEPCNLGCDPEFNGSRSRHCATLCHNAREALAAAPAPVQQHGMTKDGLTFMGEPLVQPYEAPREKVNALFKALGFSGTAPVGDILDAALARIEAQQPAEAGPVAEPEQLWAVHAQGSDDIYPAFSKEDAEKHASELNALPMPEGIAVGAVVVHSPWPAAEHWEYLAEEERDHKEQIMALAAPQSQPAAVPDGYALAPVEPTPEMLAAGLAAHLPQTMGGERLALLYRAMLAAAPAPAPVQQQGVPDGLRMAASWHREQRDAFNKQMRDDQENYENAKKDDLPESRVNALLSRWGSSSCNAANHNDYAAELDRQADALAAAPAPAQQPAVCMGCVEQASRIRELEHKMDYYTTAPVQAEPQTAAARDVLAERQRQISAEGWTPEHDDEHRDGSMALAASCYACASAGFDDAARDWPWSDDWFKPSSPRRDLIKAGALILAEIERIDRAGTAVQNGMECDRLNAKLAGVVEALRKIDRHNDNPARFDAEIDAIIRAALATAGACDD